MRAKQFKNAYLDSLSNNLSSFYDNVNEYGNPNSKNCIYFIYGTDGSPGQVRFGLPAVSRYFSDDFYLRGLYIPEFSSRKPTWEKYTIKNIEKKITKIVDDLTELTHRYGKIIVCCSSAGFYDFKAALARLSASVHSLLTVFWISCAPDHVDDSYFERILFKLNGFVYKKHRWVAFPNTNLLNWYNSEMSYRNVSRVKKPHRYFYKHDIQSRFYMYGMLWSYGSLTCFNENIDYLTNQSSTKLTMPTYIVAAQYDGYWPGKGVQTMKTVTQRYIEKPIFFVRPTSHLWVAAPEHLYAALKKALGTYRP